MTEPETSASELPVARADAGARSLVPYLLPVLALVLVGGFAWLSGGGPSGPRVRVRFDEGYGLEVGDRVRYRGIAVGEVESVGLAEDAAGVSIALRLTREAGELAREGTRFWVVRPEIGVEGVEGVETLLAGRYVALRPGPSDGAPAETFVGLEEAPRPDPLPGALRLTLDAPRRHNLGSGSLVLYRQVAVGRVSSAELSSDGTKVEIGVEIHARYAHLVREKSVFWEVSGIEMKLALMGGVQIEFDSLRTLVQGGLAFATPEEAGERVAAGRRFELFDDAKDEWKTWAPELRADAE